MILACNQSSIVKATESFDSTSFEPIIEHSEIPADNCDSGFVNTVKSREISIDSFKHKK